MNKNNLILVSIILVIVAGVGGFLGGMTYQKSQRPGLGAQLSRGNFQGRFGNQGSRPVLGQVVSIGDKSVTVKMQDGSTKIVIISGSTSINKAAQGTISDLKEGTTIAAFGTANSDGSITAQNIQINPTRGFRMPNPSPTK